MRTTPSAATRSSSRQRKMRAEFYALHAATLDPATTMAELTELLAAADAVAERHRLSEGAVYMSACRRYLLETNRSWRAEGVTEATTTWGGESAHRYRERSRPDGSYDARCSCGAATVVFAADGPGQTWHADHVAGRVPGQVPA